MWKNPDAELLLLLFTIMIIIIIINEQINVAFSPKTLSTRNKQKQRKQRRVRQMEAQAVEYRGRRHQYDVANKYVGLRSKYRLKVDSDVADVTNDGRLFHARAAATGKARSPIVLRRVTGTTTVVDVVDETQAQTPPRVDVSRASYAVCQCCAIKTPEAQA